MSEFHHPNRAELDITSEVVCCGLGAKITRHLQDVLGGQDAALGILDNCTFLLIALHRQWYLEVCAPSAQAQHVCIDFKNFSLGGALFLDSREYDVLVECTRRFNGSQDT